MKFEDITIHDTRHEATSRLFEMGLEIQEVAAITGHDDWESLKRYTHPKSSSPRRLPAPGPLRTAHDSFPSRRSSLTKAKVTRQLGASFSLEENYSGQGYAQRVARPEAWPRTHG